jgi:alkanesulfonate monooxygenase SsuD/methylene tetrahydromethanopterin reductase-like flavin-dependent oxidoreductase (luciferase family)
VDIGIGLPAHVPGVDGTRVVDWARHAEARGFASLGVIDRLVYPNYEPLTTLAAAAAVTRRVRLVTAVLLAPLHANSALLAKQAATVDRLSGGRLVLGLGVGSRPDDFEASGVDVHRRGRLFEAQLENMRRIWSGEARGFAGGVGPEPCQSNGPRLVIGGSSEAAIRRAVKFADGWIGGAAGPERFVPLAEQVRSGWQQAGRPGAPWLMAVAYFALGPSAREHADRFLLDYYAIAGERAQQAARAAVVTPELVRQLVEAYRAAGCDELIVLPCHTDLEQIDLLAGILTSSSAPSDTFV